MIGPVVILTVFTLYLMFLFTYHFVIECLSSFEYALPKWYARRPTEPTHDLCMGVTALLIATITAILLRISDGTQPFLLSCLQGLGICFWGAHTAYRFVRWWVAESFREMPHF